MRRPLSNGILYLVLGVIFTFFAIQNVQQSGWGFFTYLLIILATLDFGSGLRFIMIHFQLKQHQKKK
ncbi:hypothetical protein GCM10008967_11750 [Bacillus carboniphilus]|uniref:DUF4305 domain-containing protein n=1 Tax=Bacillus carboniphilus TaxID=86663 RepID=A0ABP3FTN2_9BACI